MIKLANHRRSILLSHDIATQTTFGDADESRPTWRVTNLATNFLRFAVLYSPHKHWRFLLIERRR